MNTLYRAAQLVRLIILEGKILHGGHYIPDVRRQALQDLHQFCPLPNGNTNKHFIPEWPWLRYWLGQLAFFKNAFKRQGGHLSAPAVRLCYIRNPKAASTALSYLMLSANYQELKHFSITREKINFLTDVNLNRQLSAVDRKALFFTVVRNPFARIVSAYRQFFEQQQDLLIYEDYLFGVLRSYHSFKDFLNIIKLIPDILKDQHLKPQHTFLTFYERQGIEVKILKLEERDTVEEFFYAYGLTLKPLNQSDAYDYRAYYDEDTLKLVHQLYDEDIRRFGYESDAEGLRLAVQSRG